MYVCVGCSISIVNIQLLPYRGSMYALAKTKNFLVPITRIINVKLFCLSLAQYAALSLESPLLD